MNFAKEEILRRNLFDREFYLAQALAQKVERVFDYSSLLDHYVEIGWKASLDPSREFSVGRYLQANPDIRDAGIEPLSHYALTGWREKRVLRQDRSDVVPMALAFYLPQFHPDPQNETWWGKGFTEWTNVSRAHPFFAGHSQPMLPGELGFYDLRLATVRDEQARLAAAHGIDGFCYYYYWFAGKKVLDLPLNEILRAKEPRFPFCLCWANENWTRRWDGLDNEILLEQKHTPVNDYGFIYDILPILSDDRYIRIDGNPFLLVYRPDLLADSARTADLWREVAVQAGFPGLYLGAVNFRVKDPRPLGFDCLVEFPPHHFPADDFDAPVRRELGVPDAMKVRSYPRGVSRSLLNAVKKQPFAVCPGIMPSWDNTARRMESATVFQGSTPVLFRLWATAELLRAAEHEPEGRRIVFVNAWNEWAEGAVLEPRRDIGRAYLEAFAAAKKAVENHLRSGAGDAFVALVKWLAAIDQAIAEGRTPVFAVTHDAQRAGAQTLLLRLIKSLRPAAGDCEIFVMMDGDGPLMAEFGPPDRVYRAFALGSCGLDANERAGLLMTLLSTRSNRPILCNTAATVHYCAAAARLNMKTVLHVCELPTSIDMYVGNDEFRKSAGDASHIVVVSHYSKRALASAYPEIAGKIEVIHPSIPDDVPRRPPDGGRALLARLGIAAGDTIVFGCGAIHQRKGVDLIPALAAEVARELDGKVRFLWCGEVQSDQDYLRWIKHDISARGLEQIVQFVGYTDELAPLYEAARVFLLPSREDPLPLVALEAAKCGTPVLMFDDAGGARELVEGLDELLVPYGDVAAMARRLIAILKDGATRKYLGATLSHRTRTTFGWPAYIDAFARLWMGQPVSGGVSIPAVARSRPKVTVAIPFYNHGRFIAEALASVAAQTYPVDEIIVIDDGSQEADRDKAAAVAGTYPNVKFASQPNRGAHATINRCIELASGDFVSILNSDDAYHPHRIEQLITAAGLRPEVGMFATEVTFVDAEGRSFAGSPWYRDGWALIDRGVPKWLALLDRNFLMTTSNFFLRTPFLRDIGELRDFRYAHDLDMLERVLLKSDIGLLRSELLSYRFHEANTIRKNMLGIRVDIAQIIAEAYVTRLANDGHDVKTAAAIAKLVREQALQGAYRVFIEALAAGGEHKGVHLCAPEETRPRAKSALKKQDQRVTRELGAGHKDLSALVCEDGGWIPEAALALAAYGRLEKKPAVE